MGYLKAMGVLRVVAEGPDRGAHGCWRDGVFVLDSDLDREGLIHFFLDTVRSYTDSSHLGRAGPAFSARTAGWPWMRSPRARVCSADRIRLLGLPDSRDAQEIYELRASPSPEEKERLLRHIDGICRIGLSIGWIPCSCSRRPASRSLRCSGPVATTGGSTSHRITCSGSYRWDSRMRAWSTKAADWLRQTLFAEPARDLIPAAVGQFDPGRAGGPNATIGMEGGAAFNPWDFVLMLEGALILAGATTRRLGAGRRDRAAFPFTVRPSAVGYGSEADAEELDSRGEIWLPLWHAPASLGEIRLLFAEGRRRNQRSAVA